MTQAMYISIILTIVVLILSVWTISKGYGFKHTIDPAPEEEENNK